MAGWSCTGDERAVVHEEVVGALGAGSFCSCRVWADVKALRAQRLLLARIDEVLVFVLVEVICARAAFGIAGLGFGGRDVVASGALGERGTNAVVLRPNCLGLVFRVVITLCGVLGADPVDCCCWSLGFVLGPVRLVRNAFGVGLASTGRVTR